jgi:hypothetical protein
MKKLIILSLLALTSCTTVRRDDHSYTYIHNFNSNSEEKPARQFKETREGEDYPFYEKNGFGRKSAVIDNDTTDSSVVINNHYNHRVAAYNPPPSYSGFSPSARRYLMYGEVR